MDIGVADGFRCGDLAGRRFHIADRYCRKCQTDAQQHDKHAFDPLDPLFDFRKDHQDKDQSKQDQDQNDHV